MKEQEGKEQEQLPSKTANSKYQRELSKQKNVEDKLLTNTAVKQENDSTSTVQEIQFKINKGTQGEDGEQA